MSRSFHVLDSGISGLYTLPSMHCPFHIKIVIVFTVLVVLFCGVPGMAGDGETAEKNELTAIQAIILGIVEGVTEYLPVSSTGHLLMAKEIMGLGQGSEAGAGTTTGADTAINAYIVVIQFGAILAILVICLNRFKSSQRKPGAVCTVRLSLPRLHLFLEEFGIDIASYEVRMI